ncbi:MAG: hypothetical protein Q4G43_11830 [Mobilicoccus sp.]|nr:hypothetical protein [Mobilicoccus sp.]
MALQALELTLDQPSDALVRADWAALLDAGLPSQARYRGATNAPHITVASGTAIDAAAEAEAADQFADLLPARIELSGVVLLGRGPYALARLLTPDAALLDAADRLRTRIGDPHSAGWIAHVTLARRLPVDLVGEALAVIATGTDAPRHVVATGLRRWNPDTGTTTMLTGG